MTSPTTQRLTRRTVGRVGSVPAAAPVGAGIVHLGLGNFHRAHQALYTALALDCVSGPWGIIGVAWRSRAITDAMRAQDGMYSVREVGNTPPGGTPLAPLVVAVHTELVVAADDPLAVIARLADPAIRIATLTVSERGYTARTGTGGLDTEISAVRADLGGAPPSTVVGLLARGLQRRWREHGEPIAIVSCDNVARNGEHVRSLVLEFIELLPDSGAAALRGWIETSVGFPCTMVDRIVPATRAEDRRRATELLGLRDQAPVVAEPFSMWVLEDWFPGGRPDWGSAGAIFSDQVEGYEQLKLRLLNATHSLIAYLGLLSGARSIGQAVERPEIRAAAEHVIDQELRPTLEVPSGVDASRYVEELFARFGNVALDHRVCDVASDGSAKLPVRITAAVLHHTGLGVVPRALALTVAAFIRCLATPDAYDAAGLGGVADPWGGRLEELGRRERDSRDLVEAVFELRIFAPALAGASRFVDAVAELHAILVRDGHRAGIEAAIG